MLAGRGSGEVYFPTGPRICLDQRIGDASALRWQRKNQSGSKRKEEEEQFAKPDSSLAKRSRGHPDQLTPRRTGHIGIWGQSPTY